MPSGAGRVSVFGVDGQDDTQQVVQGVPEARVGEFVADPPPLGDGDDQAATAQAGQVVGQGLSGYAELVGEVGRVCGVVPEREQDAGTGGIGQGGAEASEDLAVFAHRQHPSTVQRGLYAPAGVVGLNGAMRPGPSSERPPSLAGFERWLLVLPILLAVFALHAMTAEDATPLTGAESGSAMASAEPAFLAAVVDGGDPAAWLSAGPALGSSLADTPIVPLDIGPAGCLLFLAALWVLAVLRRWIPLRPPTLSSWWPGVVAGPPLWPVTRLSLGVTRI